jgi:hypothetical protein
MKKDKSDKTSLIKTFLRSSYIKRKTFCSQSIKWKIVVHLIVNKSPCDEALTREKGKFSYSVFLHLYYFSYLDEVVDSVHILFAFVVDLNQPNLCLSI